jgi:mannan endo-1,4-beta-mannosidase
MAPAPPPPGLVAVNDGAFVAGGEPFVPRGVGSYPLLEHSVRGRMDEVRDILEQAVALGRPLVRTNAYNDVAASAARLREPDGTLRDEGLAGLDRMLAEAAAFDVRLILVLTNNWTDYGGAPAVIEMAAPGEGLPKDAFWSEPRAIALQAGYVRSIVSRTNGLNGRRYAEDPTVFAWELANEARCEDAAWCRPDTLVRWARAMADAIRSAGATQPIAWGGGGHLGAHGEDLAAIAEDGAVDVLTVHVYPFSANALHLEGRPVASRPLIGLRLGAETIRGRARLARRHGMPLLVEEVGWKPGPGEDRDAERAILLGAWLREAAAEGVGVLPWMIGERGRPDYDGLLIRPDDQATTEVLRCD